LPSARTSAAITDSKSAASRWGRDALADVGLRARELGEEAVAARRGGDGARERPNEVAHAALLDVRGGAGALGPEAVALPLGPPEDDRDVLRGGLGLEEATELHARDAGHPEVRHERGGRVGERQPRAFGRIGGLRDDEALHLQAAAEHGARRFRRVDQDDSFAFAHVR
jgi:hypothetical protein